MSMALNEGWVESARERIRFVQDQLAAAASWAEGEDEAFRTELLLPYRELLDELYEKELPVAKLADESDLLLHVKGSAASGAALRVSLLAKLLTQTRDEVTRLAKYFGGIDAIRVPASLDMSFVGVASGSLFVGFSAADASEAGQSTREAVETIGDIGTLVAAEASLAELAARLPDPASRDMAVAAIHRLAPSGIVGVTEVEILGRRVPRSVSLTTDVRRSARTLMTRPARASKEPIQLVGTVREMDLDAQRFELRNVIGNETDVRCAHDLPAAEAKRYIDLRVRVSGRPEFGPRGAVRLLWVDEIEMLEDAI